MTYKTETGSIYQVDDVARRVRRLVGGAGTKRITEEWRQYESAVVDYDRLIIVWGRGRDAVSDELGTECDNPLRTTVTSRIVRWHELPRR